MVNIDNNPGNTGQTEASQTTLGMIMPSTTKTEIKRHSNSSYELSLPLTSAALLLLIDARM
jgi:hypothetical protein